MMKVVFVLSFLALFPMAVDLLPVGLFMVTCFFLSSDLSRFFCLVHSPSLSFMDSISSVLGVLSVWVVFVSVFSSYGSGWYNTPVISKLFFVSLMSMLVVLVLAFSSSSLFMFYVFFELSLVPILLVILGWGYQPERLQAGLYMILYTLFGSLPLLLFIISFVVFSSSSSWELIQVVPSSWLSSVVVIVVVILAFLIKTPIYVFHLWLPKAHVEAPTAGSMILAGVLLKLGSYGIFRVGVVVSFMHGVCSVVLCFLIVLGAFLSGLVAVSQGDSKALVAYSSVSHMSLFTGALLIPSPLVVYCAFLIVVSHGLVSSALFFCVGVVYTVVQSRTFSSLSGLLFVFPFFIYLVFVVAVANFSVPPFPSLLAEVGLVSVFLSFCVSFPVVFLVAGFLASFFSVYMFAGLTLSSPSCSTSCSFLPLCQYGCVIFHVIPLGLILLYPFSVFVSW